MVTRVRNVLYVYTNMDEKKAAVYMSTDRYTPQHTQPKSYIKSEERYSFWQLRALICVSLLCHTQTHSLLLLNTSNAHSYRRDSSKSLSLLVIIGICDVLTVLCFVELR